MVSTQRQLDWPGRIQNVSMRLKTTFTGGKSVYSKNREWVVRLPLAPMGFFRACAALAWIRLSSISSFDLIGRVVSVVGVFGSIERSAYEW